MNPPSRSAVQEAASALIALESGEEVNRWLNLLEPVVDSGVDFSLHGDAAVVEPLLALRAHNFEGYTRIMQAIDDQRVATGLPKLAERKGKGAYLAEFMRTKRSREVRLVTLWNEQFSDHQKLKSTPRKEFMAMHAKRWFEERRARLDAARKLQGRPLSREEQRRILDTVQDDIDVELDALEAFVRSEIRKPLSQRNPNGFKFQVGKL